MALFQHQLISSNKTWIVNGRYKVRDCVVHKNEDWINLTGKNSEPGTGSDWKRSSFNSQASRLKIASKAIGNFLENTPEIGDLMYGMLNDGVTCIPFGKYLGGDLQVLANYSTNPIEF